ncbi:hypothetical protein Tco_0786783 [Tanacetum coccineum]
MVFTTSPDTFSTITPDTSPSLPLPPPSPVLSPAPPPSPIRSLGYQAAMIRMRAEAASTSHSLPLPPPFILSPTRSNAPSIRDTTPCPIARLGIALGPSYEVGESSSPAARLGRGLRADYMFVATMDREIRRDPKREIGYGITDLHRLSEDEAWMVIDDACNLPAERICFTALLTVLGQIDERAEESWSYPTAAAYTDTDSDAVITGICDHATGTGGSTTGAGYRTAGTAGTRWRGRYPDTDRAGGDARGGLGFYPGIFMMLNLQMTWAGSEKENGQKKYCPRNEMKKLEAELWNLKVKGTDVIGYNQRFQELALLYVRMFLEESDKIERYVGGLPDVGI